MIAYKLLSEGPPERERILLQEAILHSTKDNIKLEGEKSVREVNIERVNSMPLCSVYVTTENKCDTFLGVCESLLQHLHSVSKCPLQNLTLCEM